jgi:hypothetical protein
MATREAAPPPKAAPGPADIEPAHNENFHRTLTGLVTGVPVLALGVAAWQSWQGLLQPTDLIVFAIFYVLTGLAASPSASTGCSRTAASRPGARSAPCSPCSARPRSRGP